MDDLIRRVYRNVVEHSEEIRLLDEIIDCNLKKMASVCSETAAGELWEQIDDIVLDMVSEVREESFILGFRYAAVLWTEAVLGSEGDSNGR